MTEHITLEQALKLVDFYQYSDGSWYVAVVKGYCGTVKGNCGTVKGDCETVEGNCGTVKSYCHTIKGDCYIVEGNCDTVEGDCGTVKGYCGTVKKGVLGTINGRQWQYVETSREKVVRLLEGGASKEELLKALEELDD